MAIGVGPEVGTISETGVGPEVEDVLAGVTEIIGSKVEAFWEATVLVETIGIAAEADETS